MSFRISLDNSEEAFDALADAGMEIGDALLSAFLYALGFGLIALIVTIIVLIIAAKKRWLKRPKPYWSWLGRVHYLLIALSLLGGGIIWGADKGIANYAHRKVENYFQPLLRENIPELREFLSLEAENLANDTRLASLQNVKENAGLVVDMLLVLYLDQNGEIDSILAQEEMSWSDYGTVAWHWGRAYLVRQVLGSAIKSAVYSQAEKVGLDEYDMDFILTVIDQFNFEDLDRGIEMATLKATHKAIDITYAQIRNGHLLMAALPLLFVLLDVFFFRFRSLRSKTTAASEQLAANNTAGSSE